MEYFAFVFSNYDNTVPPWKVIALFNKENSYHYLHPHNLISKKYYEYFVSIINNCRGFLDVILSCKAEFIQVYRSKFLDILLDDKVQFMRVELN